MDTRPAPQGVTSAARCRNGPTGRGRRRPGKLVRARTATSEPVSGGQGAGTRRREGKDVHKNTETRRAQGVNRVEQRLVPRKWELQHGEKRSGGGPGWRVGQGQSREVGVPH